ncbi:hypothetical protein CCO03_12990 [Comamonas serinivorans]|uniref:Acyl-CoA dehydrogenase C-terminal domain-containing protein n=1 Tax=Comamonas serinivorans TaxID=1082851 RepID=A0A1Y0EQ96_9BURK|nr:hypothetical protein CCO03_12990 [Comamonas serinivorans]
MRNSQFPCHPPWAKNRRFPPHAAPSLLLDVASGSGVSTAAALDRHWRNLKVVASHNPRLYKERILGDHYLNGTALPQGAFF